MKKTWKQWIAIACVLSMIMCLLPAATLAEDGVATPTDLAPVPEETAGEVPTEEPGEEPAGETTGPAIPELHFGNPGYKGTLKAGADFTIVLHSDRYANILVTLSLLPKNGQPADADGVKVLFNEKARKLNRVEKEDADSGSMDLQFEAYIAQDTDYTFVITAPFDADFTLTATNRTAAATEQVDGEEEPADEVTGEEPVEEPAEEVTGEEPAEEPTEEPVETENAEDGNEEGNNPEEPDDITITEITGEEENTVRAWISANDSQDGETVTLNANAEPEMEGVPTWYTRNGQAEDSEWKKAGYGESLTVENAAGSEYRFVLPDGTTSEAFRLDEEAAEEDPAEEPAEENEEQIPDETEGEETETAEETPAEENPEDLTEEEQAEAAGEEAEETTEEALEEETTEEELKETAETAEEKPAETDTEEPAAEEEETGEPEEEPEEETEVLPPDEELLALGYYGTQVVMSNGADIFDSLEEGAEPVGHLEAGEILWIRPAEKEGWAEIYRADETIPATYIRWDDVLINQKPETENEEEEEELPARAINISINLAGMEFISLGTEVVMTAELINFREEDQFELQWMYFDPEKGEYIAADGANELVYSYQLTAMNFNCQWKLVVTIQNQEE